LKRNNSKGGKSKLSPLAIHDIISSTQGKVHGKKIKPAKDKEIPEATSTSHVPSILKTRSNRKAKEKVEEERPVLSAIDVHQSISTTHSSIFSPATRRTRTSGIITAKTTERKSVELPILEGGHESVSASLGRRSNRLRGDTGLEPPAKRLKVSVEEPLNHVSLYHRLLVS
jgi:helicase SWR1